MSIIDPALWTARDLARVLKVKRTWLEAEARGGRLPHVQADDTLLFDPEAVETELLRRARELPGEAATVPVSQPAPRGGESEGAS